mmetsp:Transcript_60702/g.98273  ORF Transcript_60702/g.98273 Transcript_60702/m.98273 type:complete len:538 (+) Transcript_60702:92-1705(+)
MAALLASDADVYSVTAVGKPIASSSAVCHALGGNSRARKPSSSRVGVRRGRAPSGCCAKSKELQEYGSIEPSVKNYMNSFVSMLVQEAVQDVMDDSVMDIEVDSDDEEYSEATAELVAKLVVTSKLPASMTQVCDLNFDDEVMSLVSDENDEDLYCDAAKSYIEAIVTANRELDSEVDEDEGLRCNARLAAAVESKPLMSTGSSAASTAQVEVEDVDMQSEADAQEFIFEAPDSDDFALDFVSDIMDFGIKSFECSVEEEQEVSPPVFSLPFAVSPSSRPSSASARSRCFCPSVAMPPVPAEALPADCLPTSTAAPAAPELAAAPAAPELAVETTAVEELPVESKPVTSSRPSSSSRATHRRVIGGVARSAAPVPDALEQMLSASELPAGPPGRSMRRQSSGMLLKGLAQGPISAMSMDLGDRPASRPGTPANAYGLSAKTASPAFSAMALDLGSSLSASRSSLKMGEVSFGAKDRSMGKSSSLPSLVLGKSSFSKAGAFVLPALPGSSLAFNPAGSIAWSRSMSRSALQRELGSVM